MGPDSTRNSFGEVFDRALLSAEAEHRSSPRLSPEVALRRAEHALSGDGTAAAMHEPSIDLADALIARARVLAGEDAPAALRASLLAVEVASSLDPARILDRDTKVRALTSLLSTSRSAGAFDVAHRAESEVHELLNYSAARPDTEHDALLEVGRLYYREGAFREVLFFAEEALEIAEELKDPERVADSLRLLGVANLDLQDYERARTLLWRAHSTTQSLRTLFVCCQNLAHAYCGLNHYRAAHEMLDLAEQVPLSDPRPQDRLRLLWARAKTYADAGDGAKALETLETVRDGFLHLQRPQAVAECILDIALVLLERGDTAAASRNVALFAADCFGALGLVPQSIAARAIVGSASTSSALRRGLKALMVSVQQRGKEPRLPTPPPDALVSSR